MSSSIATETQLPESVDRHFFGSDPDPMSFYDTRKLDRRDGFKSNSGAFLCAFDHPNSKWLVAMTDSYSADEKQRGSFLSAVLEAHKDKTTCDQYRKLMEYSLTPGDLTGVSFGHLLDSGIGYWD